MGGIQPSILNDNRKPQLRPMILFRPLLTFATHLHLLNSAESYLTALVKPFQSAQLPCSLEISRFSNFENLSTCTSRHELVEKLITSPQSCLTLLLPGDASLSLQIHTPYQHSQTTYQWSAPFTLKTSAPSSPDAEISFDALCDAEGPISLVVNENLAETVKRILGPSWRKYGLHEFENGGQRLRVELQRSKGVISVVHGATEIQCVNRSLQDVLSSISKTK